MGYVIAALLLFMATLFMLTVRQEARVRGSAKWFWSTLALAAGVGLYTAQDMLPSVLTLTIAHLLFVTSALLNAYGTHEYRYGKALPILWLMIAIGLLFVALLLYQGHHQTRILMVAIPTIFICL